MLCGAAAYGRQGESDAVGERERPPQPPGLGVTAVANLFDDRWRKACRDIGSGVAHPRADERERRVAHGPAGVGAGKQRRQDVSWVRADGAADPAGRDWQQQHGSLVRAKIAWPPGGREGAIAPPLISAGSPRAVTLGAADLDEDLQLMRSDAGRLAGGEVNEAVVKVADKIGAITIVANGDRLA